MTDTSNTENTGTNTPNPDNGTPTPTPSTPTGDVGLNINTTPSTPTEPTGVVDVEQYTGSSVLETSINIFAAQTGVTSDRINDAIANALQYNDEKLIDVTALTQGLKPEQAAQATALAKASFAETRQHIQREQESAYALAGGKPAWDESVQVFNNKAPDHVKLAVKCLLDTGNIKALAQLVLDTTRGLGMVNTGTPVVQGGNGVAQNGLSIAEFNTQLAELERTAGNRSFEQGEYKAKLDNLMQLRNLGRQQGR